MIDVEALDWAKMDGLLPAIIQHHADGTVLMLGYMDRQALAKTIEGGLVTFFSRSRGRLWQKGETSGNVLKLVDVKADCDGDALLIQAAPAGPTCHLGTASCFGSEPHWSAWLGKLEEIVAERATASPEESYTARLLAEGPAKAAQKVGEEGVEVALAAVTRDDEGLAQEAADLLFHLLVVLRSRDLGLEEVVKVLRDRHENMRGTISLTSEER